MSPTVGELFAGIGGFSLGFERAGFRTVWQVEIDPFCRTVLERRFPDARRHEDVRTVGADKLERVDVICGGFPCQDISLAGQGAGIGGEQSGLWSEMFRVIGELRPRYVVVENVPALTSRGLDRVLADLSSLGLDAEWDCLPASDFGAPHRRERLWLVAYPVGEGHGPVCGGALGDEEEHAGWGAEGDHEPRGYGEGGGARDVADSPCDRRGQGRARRSDPGGAREPEQPLPLADADGEPPQRPSVAWPERDPWAVEPRVARMAHGIPDGLDRRKALGNALVPQIAEWLAQRILAAEGRVVTRPVL